jgi:uncharacterized protein (TIGR02246 family)
MKRTTITRVAVPTGIALLIGATAAVGVGNAAPDGPRHSAAKPSERQIAALFDQWNAALATGDPERVADRYCSDAVLLPTASGKIRTDRAQIVDYFEHFLKNKPQGTKTATVVEVLDRNSAIDTGTYVFTLTGEDGTERRVDARYTYVYEKQGGNWCIVNHHSSVKPAEG